MLYKLGGGGLQTTLLKLNQATSNKSWFLGRGETKERVGNSPQGRVENKLNQPVKPGIDPRAPLCSHPCVSPKKRSLSMDDGYSNDDGGKHLSDWLNEEK